MSDPIKTTLIIVSAEGARKERDWNSLTEEEKQASRIKRTKRCMEAAGYTAQSA